MNFRLQAINQHWKILATGRPGELSTLVLDPACRRPALWILTICAGTAIYGASIGAWQGPQMAIYVGLKLPLVVFLTLTVNSLLNGLLGRLLGSGLGFKDTFSALLVSFSIFSLIVGSLSPISLGMALDTPGPDSPQSGQVHRSLILFHIVLISFAGITATRQLWGLLRSVSSSAAARRTLFGWLAGNLFVGAQMGFLLRPIFGQPGLTIEFLRPDMFEGNFYESVWWALKHIF